MTILMKRRGLLLGMASLLAAPAVVRAESLMPVRGEPLREAWFVYWRRLVQSFEWKFVMEPRLLTMKDLEAVSPLSKDGGDYCWSNPVTGAMCGQRITETGLIILDKPSVSPQEAFRPFLVGA